MDKEVLTRHFDRLVDENGMLDYPTSERKQFTHEVPNDRERYIGMVLGKLKDSNSFEEFAANVDILFSYEHDVDQGTNDYIEGVVEKFEDIPNYGDERLTQNHHAKLAIGTIELFKDSF